MNKLLKLISEYEEVSNDRFFSEIIYAEQYLISKKFWFIQRLVENDKINFDKVNEKEKSEQVDICIYWKERKEETTDWLLMLLSIQDNPIQFLCDILKD